MISYGKVMTDTHGADYNWRSEPIDPVALYTSGGGKKHGRFSMFNGCLDTSAVLSTARSTRVSHVSGTSTRENRLESELRQHAAREAQLAEQLRQQQEQMRQQQEYFVTWQTQQQAALQAYMSRRFGEPMDLPLFQPPPIFTAPPPAPPPTDDVGGSQQAATPDGGVGGNHASTRTSPSVASVPASEGDAGSGNRFYGTPDN